MGRAGGKIEVCDRHAADGYCSVAMQLRLTDNGGGFDARNIMLRSVDPLGKFSYAPVGRRAAVGSHTALRSETWLGSSGTL